MNYKSNKILTINGQSLTSEIRTKGSMRKVYAVKCYPTIMNKSEILMQIPRGYAGYRIIPSDRYPEGYWISHFHCGSFRSLIRRGWQWYLDLPYYCYAYEHTYRAVPAKINIKLHSIKLCGDIKDICREIKHKIKLQCLCFKWRLSPLRHYREWKERRECIKFWESIGR